MKIAYRLLSVLLLPLALLRLWWRGRAYPAYCANWRERLACYTAPRANAERSIWVHAVSVGEIAAASPLVEQLLLRQPPSIVVTTTTPTGRAAAQRAFGTQVEIVYFPYDLAFIVRRFLQRFRPQVLILLETELWPQVIRVCEANAIPVTLVNARLSARSAQRYAMVGGLSRAMLGALSCVGVQTGADAQRFIDLGLEKTRLSITGSLKFDTQLPFGIERSSLALRRLLGAHRFVVVAGSTRAGEELILLDAFAQLVALISNLLLVIVPRHPERFDEVAHACRKRGYAVLKRSENKDCTPSTQIFVVDRMGELQAFYAAADVAFVGGSLVAMGGHNLLEPATVGTPILAGPHVFNFQGISELLTDAGALHIVASASELTARILAWQTRPEERNAAGRAGRDVVTQNRGATAKTLALLMPYLRQ